MSKATTFKVSIGYQEFLVDITSLDQLELFRSMRPVERVYRGDKTIYYPNTDAYWRMRDISVFNDAFANEKPPEETPEPAEVPAPEAEAA